MKFCFLIALWVPGFIFSQNELSSVFLNSPEYKWTFKVNDVSYKAEVPGNVYSYLKNFNIDVFDNDFLLKEKNPENFSPVYQARFDLKESYLKNHNKAELILKGIDTYAKVYINDSLVLVCNNAFRTWKAEIRKFLKISGNRIKIAFTSNVDSAKSLQKNYPYQLPDDERVFVRKPQYSYGWDFAQRHPGCGITEPVEIRFWDAYRVEKTAVTVLEMKKDFALVELTSEIFADKKCNADISVKLFQRETKKRIVKNYILELKPGKNLIRETIKVDKPELWWCNGYGVPHIYEGGVYFSENKRVFYVENVNLGFRKLETVNEKDVFGSSFGFKLNGNKIFVKGANYVPQNYFYSAEGIKNDSLLVREAAGANMNMLRVWGGGKYPSEDFLTQCDRRGILVWQDFMFAGGMYPGDKLFFENVKAEISEQVQRISKHPCLAMWCGNNEIEEAWNNWGWQKKYNYSKTDSEKIFSDYKKLFYEIIPAVINENDTGIFYLPSSPEFGWGHKESLLQGDSHYWGVWWGMQPFEVYEKKVGRFVSEYGFQSLPSVFTYKKVCRDTLSFFSPCVKAHQKHNKGFETIEEYMQRDYTVPKKFEDYIYVSQLLQANGMKTAIEAHRRLKPFCQGSLYWQLNDCWPVASWSSIDYNMNRKAVYYYAKRAYKNIIASVKKEKNTLSVYVVSDSLKAFEGEMSISKIYFSGKEGVEHKFNVGIEKNSSKIVRYYDDNPDGSGDAYAIHIELNGTGGNIIAEANFFGKKPKSMLLPKAEITVTALSDHRYEISSDVFAKDVYLYAENKELKLSDNFFDLFPGKPRVIQLEDAAPGSVDPDLKWKCLNNL